MNPTKIPYGGGERAEHIQVNIYVDYSRYGQVINVSLYNYTLPAALTDISDLGLPKPRNPYVMARVANGSNIVGYFEFNNGKWYAKGSGNTYASFTYIAADGE